MKRESDKGCRHLCQNWASNLSEPDLLNVTDFSSNSYLQVLEDTNDAMQIERSRQNYAYGLMDEPERSESWKNAVAYFHKICGSSTPLM